MDTGAIIAIVVIAAIILIALLVALPRMRGKAAERKLENKRQEVASKHREEASAREREAQLAEARAQQQRSEAELAQAEANKQRADAEIHAKRAELHDQGLADHELPGSHDRDGSTSVVERAPGADDGMRREPADDRRDDQGFREVSGGRAHEPLAEGGDGGESQRRFVREDEPSREERPVR